MVFNIPVCCSGHDWETGLRQIHEKVWEVVMKMAWKHLTKKDELWIYQLLITRSPEDEQFINDKLRLHGIQNRLKRVNG